MNSLYLTSDLQKQMPDTLAIILFFGIGLCIVGLRDSGNVGGSNALSADVSDGEWSDWVKQLPKSVSSINYIIEKRTAYSYRTKETRSSANSAKSGWVLATTTSEGEFGPWSSWSHTAVSETSTRQVETEKRYRYRDMRETTSYDANITGWELYNTTYDGNCGAWSDWQTSAVYASDTRQVETKEQYRYRDLVSTTYTYWGDWGSWQDTPIQASNSVQVETRTRYAYYYFTCSSCGAHMHGHSLTCPTWAGGCGRGYIEEESWHVLWSSTPHNSAGFSDWHGTGKYYAYVDGELVFKWSDGMERGEATKTQYRSRQLVSHGTSEYGSWSNWVDSYRQTTTMEVESRTVYRYRDIQPTYHFRQWSDWSNWTKVFVSESDTRQVETETFYRYREQNDTTMYHFYRWSDWSGYSDVPVKEDDDTEVKSITQYRYKER